MNEKKREEFKRALDKLLYAHGLWAQAPVLGDQSHREKLADAAVVWEKEVLRLFDGRGRPKQRAPRRAYTCEGCGSDDAPFSGGPSQFSRTTVPDGIARWCYECAKKLTVGV